MYTLKYTSVCKKNYKLKESVVLIFSYQMDLS